jgi:Fe2+ or Zn2+ uptake regulation protein
LKKIFNINSMNTKTWFTQLQQSGYRLTGARRAVVDVIQKSSQVFDRARKKYGESVAQRTGYQIKEHWLQLFGLCETCR